MTTRSRTRADTLQTATRASRKRARENSAVLPPIRDGSSSPCPNYKRSRGLDGVAVPFARLDKENVPCDAPPEDTAVPNPQDCHRSGQRPDTDLLHAPLSTPKKLSRSLSMFPSPPTTPHAKARSLLRASTSSAIIGREIEKDTILSFLRDFESNSQSNPHCLFISGGPGSGKTALLQHILELETHSNPHIKSLFFNCMGICDLQLSTLLGHVMKESSKSRKSPQTKDFNAFMEGTNQKCVLVLDEVDQLCSDAYLFSNLIGLARAHSHYLRIIGIANTHTLTADIASDDNGSRTLHFPPYTAAELSSILAARLSPITSDHATFISPATLLLASRKISSTTGDVRLLLSTLSRAIDASAISKHATVTPAHVLQALQKDKSNASSASAAFQAACNLGLQARLSLCILLLALRRVAVGLPVSISITGTSPSRAKSGKGSSANLSHVSLHSYYTVLLRSSPINPLSRIEFGDILSTLEVHGLILISLSQTRGEKGRSSISLVSGLQEAEILRGLFGDDKKQDEAKEIWDTESTRITKLSKQVDNYAASDIFTEAHEH